MIGAPLAGVWLASSLAAFANRATWLPVVAGLLLFPGLPLAWEGAAALRHHGAGLAKVRRRFLTFSDRLVLRTLAINILFLIYGNAEQFGRYGYLGSVEVNARP